MADDIVRWITVNGVHIPIKEGQTTEEAIKDRQIKQSTKEAVRKNIDDYAEAHGDIFLSNKLHENFSTDEIKKCVDMVGECYKEFGLNPSNRTEQLIFTLSADKKLEDYFATASYHNGVLSMNPESARLKEEGFSVIYHEFGHAVELKLRELYKTNFSNYDNLTNRLVHDANTYRARTFPNSTEHISNYGLTNKRELIAEGVRDYMLNKDKASPMSQSIMRTLKKYLNKKVGK